MTPKTLLVFCDGTGVDGTLSDTNQENPSILALPGDGPVEGGGGSQQYATNVLRLSRSVKNKTSKGKEQIVFYQSGVGLEANFKGDPATGTTALPLRMYVPANKIRDAYNFIAQNYEDGDDICLFGGAYTARKLAGLIDRIGLLERESLGSFFEIWRQLLDGVTPVIPPGTKHPRIRIIGVWDTVDSVYGTIDALSIKDTSLPAKIDIALHAISLQENRQKFLPTLWTHPKAGLGKNQVLKQYWFPGAHSDVGGGYERHELADISLYWIAGEVQSIIELDLEFLRSYGQVKPDPWGTSQPHNAYLGTPIPQRPIVGHETRLDSKQIEKTSLLHESNKYAPQSLKEPDYMATLALIEKEFGSGYQPTFPKLNDFEKYCKEHWGKSKLGLSPPSYENPATIILHAVYWVSDSCHML
ncbi:hypothetical protein PAXRUDRAFT_161314 [Paxillus rubicundulus Ve08.2h10]|uniref:T6SS Phospholipase effector Tle1-like catalytic domain-containing protein n=1 Tax=Paxillus rubicundulus Ve08.2h10 TaxID=930991 RepID=A0A0D0DM51_9AGAM|nr:hypothetical protein PAXRUDRAFT_161314 [Paxillus rubicundulus Ve08.2h10]